LQIKRKRFNQRAERYSIAPGTGGSKRDDCKRLMNAITEVTRRPSVCPHDCPSVCALDVEVIGGKRIGRIHGARDQTYTAGVVCAKVARYWERIHHPDRLTQPLRRVGPKGSGQFAPISWDEALDRVADNFLSVERELGPEGVWPYFYAGTMGLVMRDGIERLTHAKRYSRFHGTICVGIAYPGYVAGTGRLMGADPREMAKSDCVVIWGTNVVATQVNVMTHAVRARKERGAKIVAIDIYENETMRQADLALCVRPGTDGALACAVMHILFRDGSADWDYLERYTDAPHELEAHMQTRDPAWASAITGVAVAQIEEFATLVGRSKRSFFRLGFGFSRQRNGAVNMHAALCIPAVIGAWAHEGGGAFHSNSGVYKLQRTMIEGLDVRDSSVRRLDQSRVGAILTGDVDALKGGPPVRAMLIQNTNPLAVAPNQEKVRRGFSRGALCRHRLARHDVSGTRRPLHRWRPSAPAIRPQGSRLARGLPLQSRGDHRARSTRRRRASGILDVAARDHRLDAARIRLRRSRNIGKRAMARLATPVRGVPLPQRLRLSGRKVSLQGGLDEYACRQRWNARSVACDARSA
jgi:anaerobic selenocysteine-containing dehydrogenase